MARATVTLSLRAVRPDGIGEVLEQLARLPLSMTATEQTKIGDRIRLGFARNFTTESAGGVPWAPLARFTIQERRRLGFAGAHPILQRTRQLKLSWTDRGHPLHAQDVGQTGETFILSIASDDPRVPELSGEWEMTGRPIPPRPMHVLSEQDQQGLADTICFVLEQGAFRLGSS